MTRRYFSGSTLEQAVMAAARHYGVEPEELAYRQIQKRHGFLRSRKAFMIAVDPEQPRREPEQATGEGASGAPAATRMAEEAPAVEETPAVEEAAPAGETIPGKEAVLVEAAREEPPLGAPPPEERPARTETPAEPEHRQETPEATAPAAEPGDTVSDEELLRAAERATSTLLDFAGIEGEASATSGEERVEVEIEGPDSSVLVVEDGKGLLAIQHLLPRMLRGLTGRSSFVRVDSRDFHQKRKERLEALALKEAAAATRNGSARTLPPMAPDERRLVHLALRDMPTVVTESRGSGLHKRVVVRPVRDSPEHEDIEARHGI